MNKKVCKIITNHEVALDIYKMDIESNFSIKSGQFINININSESALLKRPISVSSIDDDTLTIYYKIKGKGTINLSKMEGHVEVLGPLGNSFPLVENKKVLIIGGGIGIAPLQMLAKELSINNKLTIVLGFRNNLEAFLVDEFKKYGSVHISTDDGSLGFKGNAIELIDNCGLSADIIYTCGPIPLIKAVEKRYYGKIPGYVSIEERMACGIGACYGCACNTVNGKKTVCKDGPIFPLGVIKYENSN